MKGVILCGGRGTRLYPLTADLPKPLIPVAGRPILLHILDEFAGAGIAETCVVTGPDPQPFEAVLRDFTAPGGSAGRPARVVCVPQPRPGGIADALRQAAAFVGRDSCAVALGDNLIGPRPGTPRQVPLRDWADRFRRDAVAAVVAAARVDDPRRFGVVVVDSNSRVRSLEEKPDQPRSDLALVGRYVFSPAVFSAIERIVPSHRGELELTDAIAELVRSEGEVRAAVHAGPWEDTGTLAGLLAANRRLLTERGVRREIRPLSPDVVLSRARLVPPVWIGRGCVLDRATVGPYASLGDGVVVRGTRVCDSVLLDRCRVEGDDWVLRGSVIGPDARVRAASRGRQVRGLLLGRGAATEV